METFDIAKAVHGFGRYRGWWWLIPELSYQGWSADFIAYAPKKGILEIEIKKTWADYRADGRKTTGSRPGKRKFLPEITKHDWLRGDYPCGWRPTHFVFAAPAELAERIKADPLLPKGFGIWAVYQRGPADDLYYTVEIIRPMRRLIKPRPGWAHKFKQVAMERAMWFMDAHYWADNPSARQMVDEGIKDEKVPVV